MAKTIARVPGLPVLGNLLDLRRDHLAFFCRVRQRLGTSYENPARMK